ncbi:hypothetical protein HPB51_006422 [Rhipicephalus microplus]|uniref:Uncharacterized protein n=1 Tax=Rhipicephalus microplus TaxID=6941 RepID=A0A9J6EYA0_RHIMP|nr:hypothetical protein HPB51_006422 [Rhipicephalus microplus]
MVITLCFRNRTAALADVTSTTGQSTLEEYWTLKNVFHYGVFDIGVQDHELSERDKILKEAFDLLKFCSDPMALYANAKVIKPGHYTGISISPGNRQLVSTYETNETISEKYCMIRQQFTTMPLGLALFDVECEDWARKCSVTSSPIAGKDRFTDILNYFKRVSKQDPASLPCKSTS